MDRFDHQTLTKILISAKTGNEDAIRWLYNNYQSSLVKYSYFLCKNNSLAEDLTQEAFITAFKNIHKLKKSTSFKSWLQTIVKRKFLDYRVLKKNTLHQDIKESPEQIIENNYYEMLNAIQVGFASLNPNEKTALSLVLVRGNTYEEASHQMGLKLNEFKGIIRLARNKFTTFIREEDIEFTGIYTLSEFKKSS